MDLYDIADGFSSLETAASNIRCPVLIMGAKTDILFPVKQQIDLSKMLKDSGNNAVTFFEMESLYGWYFRVKFKIYLMNSIFLYFI